MAKGLLIVLSNPVPGKDAEFNDWYDNVHVPHMLKVPGILNCTRALFSDVEILPGGRADGHRYLAIYEVAAEDDAGLEAIAVDLRRAFTGGQVVSPTDVVTSAVTTEAMPISDALDLATLKDTFALRMR